MPSPLAASPSDAELLAAVAAEHPGAFDAFVTRYGRRLLAFGLRMCGHHEDAEDIFQETLLKAYQGLARLEDPGAIRTWLFRVASNQCLMRRRRVGPGREISLDELAATAFAEEAGTEFRDWSRLPDEAAVQAELRQGLEEAIRELPPEHRVVLLLRDVEGLSTREAAAALDLGEGAVKMRLHRARLALREKLAHRFEERAA